MARILKEAEYNAKRSEILKIALSLVYSKGYEQMTIQDILDGLSISRGAFYHYFESKEALLEALVEYSSLDGQKNLLLILEDKQFNAIQKFRRYFEISAAWKSGQKALILSLLRVWYTDQNALIRQKMTGRSIQVMGNFFEQVIRQGIAEKVFTTSYPAQVAEIIAGVALSLTDSLAALLLTPQPDQATVQKLDMIMSAYFDTVERILGAPSGSLKVFGAEAFADWLVEMQPESS
jgi:TetR/AcrR family transcriptional regulator, transcriptional repressor for nem operon